MVDDVYEASWEVLESLNRYGSKVANQIILHTNIGSRTTLYRALDILLKEKLIIIDEKKVYSINSVNYLNQKNILKIYENYEDTSGGLETLFLKLSQRFKNHKRVLDPYSDSDKDLIRKIITKPPYYDIISIIVRFFELGSIINFLINSELMSKTIEKKATSIRRKNQKNISRFMGTIKKAEPVLWMETVILIQTRLITKISPA